MMSNSFKRCLVNLLKNKRNGVNEEAFRRLTLDKGIYKSATDD